MKRRLLLFGIACALVVGGWAGVLAAVVCPHAGGAAAGEASHSCCRGEDGGEAASCPMMFAASGGDHHQQADVPQQQADASHGAAHTSQQAPRAAAVESASDVRRTGAFERRSDFCAHCVGSRLPPPSSAKLSAPEAAKRGDVCAAPRALKPPAPPVVLFVREVIPSQGAPPGAARLHVLNSVFLI